MVRTLTPLFLVAACGEPSLNLEPTFEVFWDGPNPTVARVVVSGVTETGGGTHLTVRTEDRDSFNKLGTEVWVWGLPQNTTARMSVSWRGHNPTQTENYYSRGRDVPVPDFGLPDLVTYSTLQRATEFAVVGAVSDADGGWIGMWNEAGQLVWAWRAPAGERVQSPVLARERGAILALLTAEDPTVDRGRVVRIPLDGSPELETRATAAHDAFVELPDGRLAWLSRTFPTVDGDALMVDTVRVAAPGSQDGGTEVFDVLAVEGYAYPCAHADATWDVFGHTGVIDWSHGNSLTWDDDAGLLLLGASHLDRILAVDPETGDAVWRAGGLHRDLVVPELMADDRWAHATFAQASATGALLFDHRDHLPDGAPRLMDVAFDVEEGKVDTVWSWEPPAGADLRDGRVDAFTREDGTRMVMLGARGELVLLRDADPIWDARIDAELTGFSVLSGVPYK